MSTIVFYISYRSYTKEYVKEVKVNNWEIGLLESGWLWQMYSVLATKSLLNTKNINFPIARRGLDLLKDDSEALSLMNGSPSSICPNDLEKLFHLLEEKLAISRFKNLERTRISAVFRQIIMSNLQDCPLPNISNARAVKFRPKRYEISSGRALISDLIAEDKKGSRPPLATISFTNFSDLKKETKDTLEKDLLRIRNSAFSELVYFEKMRNLLTRLAEKRAGDEIERYAEELISKENIGQLRGKRLSKLHLIIKNDPTALLGQYVKLTEDRSLAFIDAKPIYWGASYFVTDYQRQQGGPLIRNKHFIQLPFRACSIELFCAILIIMSYTGWNIDAVLNMTLGSIEISDSGNTIIQGFKGKVDEETPQFLIEKNMFEMQHAIRLIQWNQSQLKMLGFLDESEQRLWFGWTLAANKNPHQMMGHTTKLAEFCDRNSLPRFSYDQLRTQVLVTTYVRSGSHDLTRHVAGHKNLYTLSRYLDQLMTVRANSAINLEFSKRLETEVFFDIQPIQSQSFEHLSKRSALIGDGTICVDPTLPPDPDFMSGELCDSRNCHLGTGCRNRRIVLNVERLRELIRKRRYFRNNWERLAAENPQAFEKFVFPNFLFVERLCRFIETGPYSVAFAKTVIEINENSEPQS